jgi:S-adenosylmethionine-diacylglycerol 3-amino-3-carboxypropyl transferase
MSLIGWIEKARAWPVAFAQVREDPAIDKAVADGLPPNSRMMMIASGGCTAAWLARHPQLCEITLVDANSAQLALTRLKAKLLTEYDPVMRLQILGHTSMDKDERKRHLAFLLAELDLANESLGPLDEVAALGLDYCGRYEQLFAALQMAIAADEQLTDWLERLLLSGSITMQTDLLADHSTAWQKLAAIYDEVFALPNLVALFGEGATQNRVQSFSKHFLGQLHLLLQRQPLHLNPYVWQLLCGKYPNGTPAPWLNLPTGPIKTLWRYVESPIVTEMRNAATLGHQYQLVHLSNVLDWLSEDEALATIRAAWSCTASGGWLVIRQLNSNLDIRALGTRIGWQWEAALSDQALASDRSFFYRQLHLGHKP